MKTKVIVIRVISLLGIALVIALQITTYLEEGRLTNLPKTILVLLSVLLLFFSTFLSKIDQTQKHTIKAACEQEAACFTNDKKARRFFCLGFRGWAASNYGTAYYYFSKAATAAQEPQAQAKAYFYLGRCAVEEKKYSRAIENLTYSVQLNPSEGRAWSNLARAYFETGDHEKTKLSAQTGLFYNPRHANLHSFLGNYHFLHRDFEAALKEFLSAEQLEPTSAPYAMNSALAYAGLGDEKHAMSCYHKAETLHYSSLEQGLQEIRTLLSLNSSGQSNVSCN